MQAEDKELTRSSGNIFTDLGIPEPEEMLAKAGLAHQICAIVEERGLTQIQAARLLGVTQPKVSLLTRGRLAGFSMERLVHFLLLLQCDVEIIVKRQGNASGHVRVIAA
ncbi:MAG: XRE family transcriptional regulator [Chloroflexi bacterium]|nr:XRE family transcriptional regulator [Chloroflexota bacterium]